ncbi:MAG: stage II sporulation protein M [Alicyclobacillaceae bacterium]|nr:stage II sporulation protein M [Alicyclobacillaceae bacterium]
MSVGWRHAANRYLQHHANIYRFVAVLFLVGVFFGAIIEGSLGAAQKQALADETSRFFTVVAAGRGASVTDIARHAAAVHLKWVAFIWIFGLSIVGMPFIVGLVFLKGFVIGFSIAFFVEKYAWPGFFVSMAGMLPQNLLAVPALMACATAGLAFSFDLFRKGFSNQIRTALVRHLTLYSSLVLLTAVVLMVSAGIEGVVSGWLMKAAVSRFLH